MATYTAFVGDTDNSVLGDLNVLVDDAVEGSPSGGTSVTYTSTDPTYANVSIVLTGTGISGSPSSSWHITGIEALDNGHPIWQISGLSGIDGTPTTGTVDGESIFQAEAFHGGPDLLFGNDSNDLIVGGPGAEGLFGFSGNDTIVAGSGNDTIGGDGGVNDLIGGAGHDSFVFNVPVEAGNFDTIIDFNVHRDHIDLDYLDFDRVAGFGVLPVSEFHIGAHATNAAQRIVFNQANGFLFYTPDGDHGPREHFATIDPSNHHLALAASDFLIT